MNWETIRANWVNGNCHDTKNKFYQLSKIKMLKVILEALNNMNESIPAGTPISGDLLDLRDIIRSMTQYEK